MNLNDIALLRVVNQQIAAPQFKTVKEVVGWMGAVQAQDYNMCKWAVGVRLPGTTDKAVESAIDSGEIIRTHVLRPTWHLVSSADIYWMLELSAPQIKTAMRSRDKGLGLDEVVLKKSNKIIEKLLSKGEHLTRDELIKQLTSAGFESDNNRMAHLLMHAEIEGIAGSGKIKNGKQTFALLTEIIPKTKPLKIDEAAAKLAKRYFASHGPATLYDFVWWSGLTVKVCRQALEDVKSDFVSDSISDETYFFSSNLTIPKIENDQIFLLPAFDEYLISYKNRTAVLPFENHSKAVSNNGIFRPFIIQNGQVIGIWKRKIKNDKVILNTEFFTSASASMKKLITERFATYAQFIGKKPEIVLF